MPIVTFSLPSQQYQLLTDKAQEMESPNLCAKRLILAMLLESTSYPGQASKEHIISLDTAQLEAVEERIYQRLKTEFFTQFKQEPPKEHINTLDVEVISVNSLDEDNQGTIKRLTFEDSLAELKIIKSSLAAGEVKKTNREIAERLNVKGFPSPTPGRPWTAGEIAKLMKVN